MILTYAFIIGISAFIISLAASSVAREILNYLSVLDHPEERSNHSAPVPRGGGLAVVASMLLFLLAVRAPTPLLLAILAVAVVSFLDDLYRLSVQKRLSVHLAAALLCVSVLPGPVFAGLMPGWLDVALATLALTAFMNIFNFMDGIDEISVMQTASLCLGAMLLEASASDLPRSLMFDGVAVMGAMFGFWVLNRHPATLFLGDVGSVPVGLALGYLLLVVASEGYGFAALILPAYYVTDATVTLLLRLYQGKNIMQSHSEHAYQQAVRSGWSHPQVVEWIFGLNLLLMALAVITTLYADQALLALVVAYALSFALRSYFTISVRTPAPANAAQA